jgi:hypothetical protein
MTTPHPPMAQERDSVPSRPSLAIAAAFVAMVVVSALASFVIIRLAGGSPVPPPENIPRTVSGLHLTASTDLGTQKELAQARQRLESYGWEDRARGIVHVPIERAMHDMAGE